MVDKDDKNTEVHTNQDAVIQAGVSESYLTKPTTLIDLETRLEAQAETAEDRQKRVDGEFTASGLSPFAVTDEENTENLDVYAGVEPTYKNYADVTHKPFAAAEGAEAEAEKRALESVAELEENSRQAATGFTTYGPSIEIDPVGRTEAIVRGGSGDAEADRKAVAEREASVQASTETQARASVTPESKPRSAGTSSKAKE